MNNNIILYTVTESKNQIKVGTRYATLITDTPTFGEMQFKISLMDVKRISKHRWRAVRVSDNRFYAYSATAGYLHRFIMSPDDSQVVDHVDHNTFDNRRTNLRNCTQSENNANKSNTKFLVSGITITKNNKYLVRIRKGQTIYFRTTEDTLDEAIKARLLNEITLGFLAHSHLYNALLEQEEINTACNDFFTNLEAGQVIETINSDKIRNMIREIA